MVHDQGAIPLSASMGPSLVQGHSDHLLVRPLREGIRCVLAPLAYRTGVQQMLTDISIDHPAALEVEFGLLVLDPSRPSLLLDEGMFEAALDQGAWSGWLRLEDAGGTRTLDVSGIKPPGLPVRPLGIQPTLPRGGFRRSTA